MLSPAGPLDVFNTHLHANYSHKVRAKAVASAAAADVRGKVGSKAKATVTAGKAAATAAMTGKAGQTGKTGKTGKAAATATGGGDGPLRFDVPLDSFAPFRVSQICELAQVRQREGMFPELDCPVSEVGTGPYLYTRISHIFSPTGMICRASATLPRQEVWASCCWATSTASRPHSKRRCSERCCRA